MSIDRQYHGKVKPAAVRSEQGAMVAHIECVQCGAHDRWRLSALPEPNIIRRHFSVRGWSTKRKAICPNCKSKKETKPVKTPAKPEAAAPAQIPTPDARAQRREAHGLIELSFDIGKGCYKEGYSDARIASETGATLAWVKRRREEEFGPLKQPDEIVQFREEIEAVARQLAGLSNKLATLTAKNGWSV